MKINNKALKTGFLKWLTLSLAPMSVIILMTCMAAEPTWITWACWGAAAVGMLSLFIYFEHKFGNHQ